MGMNIKEVGPTPKRYGDGVGFVGICIINMVNGFIYIYIYVYIFIFIYKVFILYFSKH